MSITDEGHYGPKQLNLLKTVWGEGFLSPGGTDEIDEVMKGIDASGKSILDIGCGCGGAAFIQGSLDSPSKTGHDSLCKSPGDSSIHERKIYNTDPG